MDSGQVHSPQELVADARMVHWGIGLNRYRHAPFASEMVNRDKCRVVVGFSLAVIASGCIRYFSQEGGEKGLWFGAVMGALGLASSALLRSGHHAKGVAASFATVALVGGWFFYESVVLKGLADAEPRQLVVLALAIVTAGVLAWPSPEGSTTP